MNNLSLVVRGAAALAPLFALLPGMYASCHVIQAGRSIGLATGKEPSAKTDVLPFLIWLCLGILAVVHLVASILGAHGDGVYKNMPGIYACVLVSIVATAVPVVWYIRAKRTRVVAVEAPVRVDDYVFTAGTFDFVPGKTEVRPLPYSVNVTMRGTKQNGEEWKAVAYVTIADFEHGAFVRLSDVENDIRDVLGKVGAKETTAEAITKKLTQELSFCTKVKVVLTTTAKHKQA